MLATPNFEENLLVLLEMAAMPETGRDRQARVAQTGQPSRAFLSRKFTSCEAFFTVPVVQFVQLMLNGSSSAGSGDGPRWWWLWKG
jgi:hypothetical protein